jgi:chondroitin AC lyase
MKLIASSSMEREMTMGWRKLWALALSVGLSLVSWSADAELEKLRQAMDEAELAPTRLALAGQAVPDWNCSPVGRFDFPDVVTREELKRILAQLRPDGTFADVDYLGNSRSEWLMARHFFLVRQLAIACRAFPAAEVQELKIEDAFHRSLAWWLAKKPTNPNWWYMEIGMPRFLGISCLLMRDRLTPEERQEALKMMARCKNGRTGQNRLWQAINVMIAGLLMDDPVQVDSGVRAGLETVVSAPAEEGIQPDWSFRQHGAQFYQGNYGHHFLLNSAWLAQVVKGSRFEFTPGQLATVENLALQGTRWMTWGMLLDYSAWGRQCAYEDRIQGPALRYACLALIAAGAPHQAELRDWQKSLETGKPLDNLNGTRIFWRSDYGLQRTGNFLATVRMNSARTLSTEICNGENLRGAFLCEGTTFLYRDAGEYDRIFPVWDWNRLPGTTTLLKTALPPVKEWSGKAGPNPFAGGVSDGRTGALAMECRRFGISANKAWIMAGDGLLMLAGDIRSAAPEKAFTCINQCLLRGPVEVRQADGRVSAVWHDGFGYFFIGDPAVVLEKATRKGSWFAVRDSAPKAEVSAPVFLLGIDHGAKPQGASAACWIEPMTADDFARRAGPPASLKLLASSAGLHAVARDDLLWAVFHQAGKLEWHGAAIAVDQPCLLQLRQADQGFAWTIAEPTQKAKTITLTINGQAKVVELPQAGLAGSSVSGIAK